jgi:enoyl-CoA hydratase/carnithine racemase
VAAGTAWRCRERALVRPWPHPLAFHEITYQVDEGTAVLALNRPDARNAMSPRMEQELCAAFDLANRDDSVRAVVVTGSGKMFCVGADLASGPRFDMAARAAQAGFADGEAGPEAGGGRVALSVYRSLKPVVAAINGPAVGGGAAMTLPMDVRVAAREAKFGFGFTRIGITPGGASSWFLPRVVGINRALDWMLSGRVISADEALDAGLVHAVRPPDEVLSAAIGEARRLADGTSPVAVALTRRLLWRMLATADPAEAHRLESALMAARGTSADVEEGVNAFLEKRRPAFPMRVTRDMPRDLEV